MKKGILESSIWSWTNTHWEYKVIEMKKSSLSCMMGGIVLLCGVSVAGAAAYSLPARGDNATSNLAVYQEFTLAMQTSVSSGTGVIDPFLTIEKKTLEQGYNSDYFPVMDAQRPAWNRSLLLSDLVLGPAPYAKYYEFLLDINEPAAKKDEKA